MGQHLEALESVVAHHGHGIERHRAFGIGLVFSIAADAGRITVAAQIHHDHGKHLGQLASYRMPHQMRLRVPVQQQKRCATATPQGVQRTGGAFHLAWRKTFKHRLALVCFCRRLW